MMNKNENIWDIFLEFEENNNLFDFKDKNGIHVWDIIRYSIYTHFIWNYPKESIKKKHIGKILHLPILVYYFTKNMIKDCNRMFFFISSRNLYEDKLIDQNAYEILKLYQHLNPLIIETYTSVDDKRLLYRNCCPNIVGLISKFVRVKYDFTNILDLLGREFRSFPTEISEEMLEEEYKCFYAQYYLYQFIFKLKRIDNIFITQNGLQKGLIAAAHKLNISVHEFQHGIVEKGHLVYSYPHNVQNLEQKIYTSDIILSLSPFWFSDCYIPNTSFHTIGNDFFAYKVPKCTNLNSILIISADVFGEDLKDLLLEILEDRHLESTIFYFKLHPNQFDQYDYYCEVFHAHANVKVIRNEYSVSKLLSVVNFVLLIQSTAAYEALNNGVKVIIYKRNSYKRHSHIFGHNGVFLVDSCKDFVNIVNEHMNDRLEDDRVFFSPFDVKYTCGLIVKDKL